jgi:hypothetical protein
VRRKGVVGAVAVAVLGSVAYWLPTGPAQAAVTNDPTCGTSVNGTPVNNVGAAANDYVLNVGNPGDLARIWQSPPGSKPPAQQDTGMQPDNKQSADPVASSRDIIGPDGNPAKQVDVEFSEGLDRADDANPPPAHIRSLNGAATFPASSYDSPTFAGPYTVLRDGSLLGVDFTPPISAPTSTGTVFRMYRSVDNGASWDAWDAPVPIGIPLGNEIGRTHRAPLELADGRILVSFYITGATESNDKANRAMVAISADGGHSFTSSLVAKGSNSNSYNETGVAQLNSGTLVAVTRHHVWNSSSKAWDLATPVESTSSDGVTWSTPTNLSVTWPYGYDPFNDSTGQLLGIAPNLTLMPNGVLMLSSGRPDNWVAMSTNGLGTGWVGQVTYRNCPTSGYRLHGSTGNTGETAVASNRMIQVGDNCDNTWACPNGESGYTTQAENWVWRRYVDVLTPDVGKIDLATKYRQGLINVQTNMNYTTAAHPRTGVAGAFDGSTEYWSSAVSPGGDGTYTIQLDQPYDLTRIGLALRNGRAESATVSLSNDGTTWTTPVVNVSHRTDLALNYQAFATPQTARFVRVSIPAESTCDSAVAASCAFLNELELYSTTDSFENDPLNVRPRGYSDLTLSWVTNATGTSSRALRVVDTDSNQQARAMGSGTAATSKTLRFRVAPQALANAFLFDVLGKTSSGSQVTAYHFAVTSNGTVQWCDSNRTWHDVTAAGAVPVGRWSDISVSANLSSATVAVNGTPVTSAAAQYQSGAATLSGFLFASNGKSSVGDDVLVDDVKF